MVKIALHSNPDICVVVVVVVSGWCTGGGGAGGERAADTENRNRAAGARTQGS